METTTISLEEAVAEALLPVGLHTMTEVPVAAEVFRQQANVLVGVFRNLLRQHPELIEELGWQRVGLRSENDKLQRPFYFYAPPGKEF